MAAPEKKVVQPNKQQLLNRLKRIEGQVRGIHKMVDEDRYCVDVLNQVSAVNSALHKVSMALLADHTHHCVARAVQNDNGEEAIDEVLDVMERLLK
ncbi:metal-sensitive transcriptional regulator [Bacillus daqingensis]|uniref:Metal-sensitive transcriptional regulator n=2 Tax=Bacillaceae TaxID=186817 RepID=A0A969PV23_9BACI|nr:metal-sensitive transcriptional regulator [Alkalicoccus luteus]NJP36197.1 metal-sensitive transcriptional regulator [Alkalicoccus luteus]